jgi:acyl-CoA synthetase (AMP-forming)/AMP-acid ligase II
VTTYPDRLWPLVEWRAAATPDGEMLVDEHGRRVSFGEFRRRALRVAANLAAQGVRSEDVISWQLPTQIETLILVAALSRLGVIQVPLMPNFGGDHLDFVMRQTGASRLITEQVDEADGAVPAVSFEGDPIRWIFYTSGTTADPKGAQHTDGTVLASARCMGDRLECTADDRVGMAFPVAHVGGCGTWLGIALREGTTLILDAAFDPARTTELLQREGVTLAGSGTVFTQIYLELQRKNPQTRLFPTARAFTTGAAPKPADLHEAVKRELGGVGVLAGYGMTEAPVLAMASPNDPDDALANAEGRVCDGVSMRVVDGELRVKAPQVMRGYVDATLNESAFDTEGWLRTGDLGRVDEDGNVFILGRSKDVVIRKGETLSAKAIEDDVLRHPQIADVAVIGVAHAEFGEIACAVVVLRGDTTLTLADLTSFLAEQDVPKRRWPERLEIATTLPRSPAGKVQKGELRDSLGL